MAQVVEFDESRAMLKKPDFFKRFRVPNKGELLKDKKLSPDTMLIIVEREQKQRAFLVKHISYHHVAQGSLSNQPYIISFCGICHSGVGLIPIVDGNLHHFSAGGLYNGTVLLIDDETKTYWNHITGEGLHGSLKGKKLEMFSLEVTNVEAALAKNPNLSISMSKVGLFARVMGKILGKAHFSKGFFPPSFKKTMGKIDNRLPTMTHGLGVSVGRVCKFYPYDRIGDGIQDNFTGRQLIIKIGDVDKIPFARWESSEKIPSQLFTRWYGFSFTFPNCEIYKI